MKNVISTERIPIKMWLDDMDDATLDQAKNLANLPFAFKHIAIMPDSHLGYGMPIGGVLATKGYIVPNAVGVDIGCGMCAVKTNLTLVDIVEADCTRDVMSGIRKRVPLGFDSHDHRIDTKLSPDSELIANLWPKALTQIGTLGGGNHFIEIQRDSDDRIWVMIHSGSRGLGFKVAAHHNKIAERINGQNFSIIDKKQGLAFFEFHSPEGLAYYKDMRFCVEYAYENRMAMMDSVLESLFMAYGPVAHADVINLPHNYAAFEEHFGQKVIVHRKGATSAKLGELGIIPGSQGANSYIVRGKGNQDSFNSCSHGAGRQMGRNQARKQLDFESEVAHLNELGVIHSLRDKRNLDEAPGAYKDIHEVMSNQEDLVDVVVELLPLAVVKG